MPTLDLRGVYPAQHDFITDIKTPHCLFQGGLGSGKSAAGARKLIFLHALNDKSWSAICAPTYSDCGRYCIPKIQEICDSAGIKCEHFSRSKQYDFNHLLLFGRPIVVCSADAPKTLVGWEASNLWMDEACRVDTDPDPIKNPWLALPSRIRCHKAKQRQCNYTTTSEGSFTEVYRRWFKEKRDDHKAYIARTKDNPFVTHSQLADYTANIPMALIPAYLEGETIDYSESRCFPNFDKENVKPFVHQDGGVWRIGTDFNISKMSWTLSYHVGDTVHTVDEHIIQTDALVENMVKQIAEKGWLDRQPLHVHGDRTGGRSRQTGLTDQIITINCIQNMGIYVVPHFLSGANAFVRDRINVTNSRILNANNARRYFVDPKCENLIRQFYSVSRTPEGKYPKDEHRDPHMLESVSYVLWDLFKPIGKAGVITNTLYT